MYIIKKFKIVSNHFISGKITLASTIPKLQAAAASVERQQKKGLGLLFHYLYMYFRDELLTKLQV